MTASGVSSLGTFHSPLSLVSFQRALLPKFLIRGHLNSTNCVITQPLTGELVVESSEAAIKSIELQLVRVETCGKGGPWGDMGGAPLDSKKRLRK